MPTKFKGTTKQKDSAGKLREDQDITPFTICQAQMAKPYPHFCPGRKWAEEHLVSVGGVASLPAPFKGPKADRAGQGRTLKRKVRFGVLVIT